MRRHVWLLTKTAGNGPSINVISPKSLSLSSFLKPNSIPFHRGSLSEYSTPSRSHLWKISSPNGLRGAIQNGAFPTSLLARRFFSNALLQGRPKSPVTFLNRRSLSSFSPDSRWRSLFRRLIPEPCVVLLIMTNVIVLVLWRVAPQNFMVLNFMMSVQHIKCGLLYTMITSAFSHIIVGHLISNMLILSIFGTRIARKFGPKYLLKLYLGGAIGGSMGFLVYQAFIAPLVEVKQAEIRHSDLQGLGASAAVGAIMVHDILLLPPVGALLGGVFLIGMEMLSRWTLLIKIYGMPPNMRLEWEWEKKENAGARAHLGGAAAGGLAWLWKRKGRFGRF